MQLDVDVKFNNRMGEGRALVRSGTGVEQYGKAEIGIGRGRGWQSVTLGAVTVIFLIHMSVRVSVDRWRGVFDRVGGFGADLVPSRPLSNKLEVRDGCH